MINRLAVAGRYMITLIQGGIVVKKLVFNNGIVNTGKEKLLDILLADTPKSDWYFGLIAGPTATLNAADTLASHTGWTELTDYEDNRKQYYASDYATNKKILGDVVEFTMTDEVSIRGAFLCSDETETSGTLFSTGLCTAFTAADESIVRVQYTLEVN